MSNQIPDKKLKRKNYGAFILIASLVVGVFLLTGSFIWMADKANMMLAVFVLILYGVGQWMTVVYWQNIQNDWEATGEVLGRLQQAVSQIPEALDSNLKAIAEKLSQGQQEALSKLQSEVSEGAKQTLEKGAILIGESIAKNFQIPVNTLNTLLTTHTEKSNEQSELLKTLVKDARNDSKQSVETGANLVSQSLEKNLRAPLAAMETTLQAWRKDADAQSTASLELGKSLQKSQSEWMLKAQNMVDELKAEFQNLISASSQDRELAQSKWAEHAEAIQASWENSIQSMQASLLETVSHEGEKMGSAMIDGGHALITKLEGLQVIQSQTQSEILDRALSGIKSQGETLNLVSESFESGLQNLRDASLKLIRDVEEKTNANQLRLVQEISKVQNASFQETAKSLEAQGQMGLEVAEKISELSVQMSQSNTEFQKLSQLSNINQTELQANVSMLNTGLVSILERLEKQAETGDGQQNFLGELARALAAFQERASDVLIENAMKTQEILMEVLRQSEAPQRAEALISNGIDSEAMA